MVARDPEPEYAQKRLYLPGPTEVPEDVLDAMSQPMFGHRTPRMTELYTTIVEDTKRFLDTSHDVIILSCSGTEFWEATTLNMVDERMAVATCGSFSAKRTSQSAWARTSTACSTSGARPSSQLTSGSSSRRVKQTTTCSRR